MTTPSLKVTQVKLDVRQIIENLKKLEDLEGNSNNLGQLISSTDKLLDNLESQPLEYLKNKLAKQQKKRNIKKRNKERFQEKQYKANVKADSKEPTSSSKSVKTLEVVTKTKPHHQLRSLQESQRFLKTFELLEQLHLSRGQTPSKTRKFSAKLQQVKSIWNCLLQEQQQEQTSKILKIQQQWNEVLFGPPEKMYFQEKPNLQNLVTKRQIWDSYIDNEHGSGIPTGWILPPLEPKEEWCPFLAASIDI